MNEQEFCTYVGNLALKSMLYEVSATPKPGLVDRMNSGAHKDMNFYTFIDSAIILSPFFKNCTKIGIDFKGQDYKLLLESIRKIGIEAENIMFKATNGVNTHKGLIFSLGIISAAAGNIFSINRSKYIKAENIIHIVRLVSKDITNELIDLKNREKLTYGEKLYIKYGITGIRGEVENGFPTVMNYSLPIFKKFMAEEEHKFNDIMVHTLLFLILNTEDSNIIGRHNIDTLNYAKSMAKTSLDLGGYLSVEGKLFVKEMDKIFIEKNISPGGSADLLGTTLMFYYLENGIRI